MQLVSLHMSYHRGRMSHLHIVLECIFHLGYMWVVANVSMTCGRI